MKDIELAALLAPVGFVAFALIVAGLSRLGRVDASHPEKDRINIGIGGWRLITVTNSQLTLALAVVTAAISVFAISRG
jgi:hypothetical protein